MHSSKQKKLRIKPVIMFMKCNGLDLTRDIALNALIFIFDFLYFCPFKTKNTIYVQFSAVSIQTFTLYILGF